MVLQIQQITFAEACEFIRHHHRHNRPPQGCMFGVDVNDGERVVGVATAGRPVARENQDRWTLEVSRCCTVGTDHETSKLYAACWRAARAMGYRWLITYVLAEEPGTSLAVARWRSLY